MTVHDIREDWTRLGEEDPLWAVLVAPGKRGGGWDTDEFLATGKQEVDAAMACLATFGGTPAEHTRALDFGCGAGRLSQALAAHFDEVIGVDIAEPMLATARRLDRTGGRCTFVLNERPDLAVIPDGHVDLVFTSLVLQHIPPALAEDYLREFSRVTRPGGAVVFLVPTSTRLTPQGLLFRYAPHGLVRWLQQKVLRYPAPMRMHTMPDAKARRILASAGLSVVGTTEEPEHGPHWRFTRYYAVKRPA